MKAILDAKDLAAAVGWVMRAVPNRPAQPVLGAVPLTVADGELTVEGFDYETHARGRVIAHGDLGTVHVLGSMLAKVAPELDGNVSLSLDGSKLLVAAGKDKYRLPIVPGDDYPTLPAMPPAMGDCAGLIEAVTRVAPSAATADDILSARRSLGWVSLAAQDGMLILRATDGYRMSRAVTAWDGQDFATLAPAKMLSEYARAIGVGRVTLHADESHFAMTSGGFTVSTVLIEDEYPTPIFARIDEARAKATAEDSGGVLVAPRAELVKAIKRGSIILEKNQPLRLTLSEDEQCTVGAAGEAEASVALPGQYMGEPFDILITSSYLASLVDSTPAPYVAIGVWHPERTVHIVGCDEAGAAEEAIQHAAMARRKGAVA